MGPAPQDWSLKVGTVLHDRKEIVSFEGLYRAPSGKGGTQALFKWKCLLCDNVYGPSQYGDIKRYPYTVCCSKSAKYGQTRWGYKHVTGEYMRSLHSSAMKRGLDFAVSSRYLYQVWQEQEGKCAYTKLPLSVGKGIASVDRIDPSKGYEEGNVQWVLTKVNMMKWDLTDQQFIENCKLILEGRGYICAQQSGTTAES